MITRAGGVPCSHDPDRLSLRVSLSRLSPRMPTLQAVCKAAGECRRGQLLARKGIRNPDKSSSRLLIPELLSDLVHVVKKTDGCVNFVRIKEGMNKLGEPMGGAVTRWGYWTLVCKWLAPTTGRLELIVRLCLLHTVISSPRLAQSSGRRRASDFRRRWR